MKKFDVGLVSAGFGVVVILVVITLAVLTLINNEFMNNLHGAKRTGFVILMFVYAGYRAFRLWSYLKARRTPHEE